MDYDNIFDYVPNDGAVIKESGGKGFNDIVNESIAEINKIDASANRASKAVEALGTQFDRVEVEISGALDKLVESSNVLRGLNEVDISKINDGLKSMYESFEQLSGKADAKALSRLLNSIERLAKVNIDGDKIAVSLEQVSKAMASLASIDTSNAVDFGKFVNSINRLSKIDATQLNSVVNDLNNIDMSGLFKEMQVDEALAEYTSCIEKLVNSLGQLSGMKLKPVEFEEKAKNPIGFKPNTIGKDGNETVGDRETKENIDKYNSIKESMKNELLRNVVSKVGGGKATGVLSKAGTASSGIKAAGAAGISATGLVALGVIGLLVASLGEMAKAGKYGAEQNQKVAESLKVMGDASDEYSRKSVETSNNVLKLRNSMDRIKDNMGDVFSGFFGALVDIGNWFADSVVKLTDIMAGSEDKLAGMSGYSGDIYGYASKVASNGGAALSKSLPVLAGISGDAQQSGFSLSSSNNLAMNTYSEAIKLQEKFGQDAIDIADRLADAWKNGSDAAKAYGVVVDDQTLMGFMSKEKGIDIANVQISDAMKEYYRYQLMEEELNADSKDAMQDKIQAWKQLGMEIDITKNKLFSFDEVIQLDAADTSIPEIAKDLYYGNGSSETGTVPITPSLPGTTGNLPDFKAETKDVREYELELEKAFEFVTELDTGVVTEVSLTGAYETVQQLEGLRQRLTDLGNSDVSVETEVVIADSMASIDQLVDYLNQYIVNAVYENDPVFNTKGASEAIRALNAYGVSLINNFGYVAKPIINIAPAMTAINQLKEGLSGLLNMLNTVFGGESALGLTGNEPDWYASTKSQFESAGYKVPAYDSSLENSLSSMMNLASGGSTKMWNNYSDMEKMGLYINNYETGASTQAWGGSDSAIMNYIQSPQGIATAILGGLSAPSIMLLPELLPLLGGGEITLDKLLDGVGGYATGGIGVHETFGKLFEGDKKEAIIPLETKQGKEFMADSFRLAIGESGGNTNGITITQNINAGALLGTDKQAVKRVMDVGVPYMKEALERNGIIKRG